MVGLCGSQGFPEDNRCRQCSYFKIVYYFSHFIALKSSSGYPKSSLKLSCIHKSMLCKSPRRDRSYSPLCLSMKGYIRTGLEYNPSATSSNHISCCKSLVPHTLMLWKVSLSVLLECYGSHCCITLSRRA